MEKNYLNFKRAALALSFGMLFCVTNIKAQCTPTITIVSSPASGSVCTGASATLSASGASTYTWDAGQTTSAIVVSPSVTTTYSVTGTSTGACTSSTFITITVNPLPTISVSISQSTLCSGNPVTLSASGNAANYMWAGTTNTTSVLTDTPNGSSTATSTVKGYTAIAISADGCTATAVADLTVVTTPVVTPVVSPLDICAGSSATLFISGAASYTWLPINAFTASVVVTPTVVPSPTAIVEYTVISANDVCTATHTVDLTVHEIPVIFAIANPVIACAGLQTTLTAGGAINFTWSPVTTPSTGANVIITPTANTTYSFVGFDGYCFNSNTIAVAVNPVPTVAIVSNPSVVCSGSTAILTASGGINYTWTASNSTVSLFGQSITVNPTVTTSYSVVGDNSVACTNVGTNVLFVNPLPTLTATPVNTTVCLGRTITVNAAGPNLHFLWSANSATTTSVAVHPTVTTVYSVTGTSTITGCSNTKTVSVHVFNPAFHVVHDTSVCKGNNITIIASGATSYTWQPGNINGNQATFSPTTNVTYSITGTATTVATITTQVLSCQASYTLAISVNPSPTVIATTYNHIICRGETALLNAYGALTYSWHPTPASGTGSTVVVNSTDSPNYVNSMIYTVIGTDANHCKNTTTIEVITSGCVGIEEQAALNNSISVYPNPNNGQFTVKTDQNITLNMINELGQSIKTIILSDSNSHNAEITELANGIYFLVGSNQNGSVKQKIIINK